jgi:hypothetical protein
MGTLSQMVSAAMRHKGEFPVKEDLYNYPAILTTTPATGGFRNGNVTYRHVGVPGIAGLAPPSSEYVMGAWMAYGGASGPVGMFTGWRFDPGPPVDYTAHRPCGGISLHYEDGELRIYSDDTGPWTGLQNNTLRNTESSRQNLGILHREFQWMHIGAYFKFGGSQNFECSFYVDGLKFMDYVSGNNEWLETPDLWSCGASMQTTAGWLTHYFDSFYIMDVTGEGDQVPEALRALMVHVDGAGSSTQWTPDAGNNWDRVDDTDAAPDDDSSYVETATAGNLDLYTHDGLTALVDLPYSYTFEGNVMVQTRFKNVDDGEVTQMDYEHAVKVGASQSVAGTHSNATLDTYDFAQDMFSQQPDASAWNLVDFNNAEFGYNSK